MKSDATSGISGAAGTPLARQAIQSGRDSINRNAKLKRSEAISDTLETSDRDGDGRQPWTLNREAPTKREVDESSTEGGIDLIG